MLITYGKFRFLDLGDLTKAKEIALVCPNNPIPPIDLYLATHHGMNLSNAKAIVDAIHPRVTIMNNGAHKAGSPEAWQTIHESPGMTDLYMLHTAEGSDAAHNSAAALIANPKGSGSDGALFQSGGVWRWQLLGDQYAHRADEGVRAEISHLAFTMPVQCIQS